MDDHHERDPGRGLPWAFVLDPAANARALGDVQRRGLRAAQELVDRVVGSIDPAQESTTGSRTNGSISNGAGPDAPFGDLVQACGELAAQVLAAMAGGSATVTNRPVPGAPERSITVDVTEPARPVVWRLRSDSKGQLLAPVELWLHNPSATPVGPLRLRVGALQAADGAVVGGSCVQFDPEEVAELPARSARGVEVALSVDEQLHPGTYRGLIQADGAPNVCVTLEIAVGDDTA